MTLWLKAFALWSAILVLAVLNGMLRQQVLIPSLGSVAGLVLSGALLSTVIFIVAWAGAPWYGKLMSSRWLLIGAFWFVLTLMFEFGVGRLVQHRTWADLLEAYTFEGGNLWPLVLAAALLAPWCVAKLRRKALIAGSVAEVKRRHPRKA
jgi:hypothetical protein